jgi:hypothetical protein
VKSGDATSHNQAGTQTGPSTSASALALATGTALATSTPETGPAIDIATPPAVSDASNPTNLQEGDNRTTTGQMAGAVSGDAVAGQIAGVVTAAGGRATGVLANTSSGIDSRSGDATFDNVSNALTGIFALTFRFATP